MAQNEAANGVISLSFIVLPVHWICWDSQWVSRMLAIGKIMEHYGHCTQQMLLLIVSKWAAGCNMNHAT